MRRMINGCLCVSGPDQNNMWAVGSYSFRKSVAVEGLYVFYGNTCISLLWNVGLWDTPPMDNRLLVSPFILSELCLDFFVT